MNQLFDTWNGLNAQRKLVAVLSVVATIIAFVGVVRLANAPNMALLYSGLEATTSGEIVASLEKKAIPYEIRGDAIYVESSSRDEARMSLAGEGLPSNGIAGYELLDTLSGFGTTSQMFDAAYWRAKEGELARTILASERIKMARVHIAQPSQQPFAGQSEASASVTVSTKNGALGIGQAEAIRYLVAAAVSDMSPEQVTVIDTEYGIILQPGIAGSPNAKNGELDARAAELRANVERLLTARVGAGNAVVEVMIEAQTERETVTERILDPEGSVAVSSDSETNTQTSSGGVGGAVTVASNLPDTGDGADGGQESSNQSQIRERVNYELSETVRERVRLPGDIARLSVAVLLNYEAGDDGTGFSARTDEEIAALTALVQSAVGFDASRGDVVTIENMLFPAAVQLGTAVSDGGFANFTFNFPALIQLAVLGLVTLALGIFVVRPVLLNPAPQLTALPTAGAIGDMVPQSLSAPGDVATIEAAPKDPVEILRETIALRSAESGHVLRNWIESDAPKNQEEVV